MFNNFECVHSVTSPKVALSLGDESCKTSILEWGGRQEHKLAMFNEERLNQFIGHVRSSAQDESTIIQNAIRQQIEPLFPKCYSQQGHQ